ncbi:MAG TPA: exodeoxyribonuclease VII large subunit [Sphingomonas sp.]|nr:exodeoxyribonuclease VII large subunit [Sphingomonas sp.]
MPDLLADPASSPPLVADVPAGSNAAPMSVSELAMLLKRHVESGFSHVRIRGEISGWRPAASGHAYFCLKDDKALIDGVMWKDVARRLAFAAGDGIEVIATGKLTTYPGRSRYQIVVESLELAGEGAMLALLDKRRRALEAEGLFDPARKRPLPYVPRHIGVVTSPTGAVIRDILHRLADRFPSHVTVWPVLVQGQGSAEQVAAAVTGFGALPEGQRPDLLIVARGGGSIEDLWGFNEEIVVRAVAASSIPVISAVGHETDTTLCDFAADVRAPTPTAAAEMAVPVRLELLATVEAASTRTLRCARRYIERGGERLDALAQRLPERQALLQPQAQRVDDLAERLRRGLSDRASASAQRLARASGALRPAILQRQAEATARHVAQLGRLLGQLNPDAPLSRGYARITDRNGKTLISAAAATKAGGLNLRFSDGEIAARVEGSRPKPYSPPTQPTLFEG